MHRGRVVVVTGAGGEIGGKIVERFLRNENSVVGLDRSESALQNLYAKHEGQRRLAARRVDITNGGDIADFKQFISSVHDHVDALVNCGGFFPIVSFEEMTSTQWQEVIRVNLTGTFLFTRAMLPLLKLKGWGRIINIGSASTFEGVSDQVHYVAAKAGVVGFTRSLAMALSTYGITVNAVAPGLTLTEPIRSNMPEPMIKAQIDQRAIKRNEGTDDLAGPVFLLASPDADFVSGQILVVDGGKVKS